MIWASWREELRRRAVEDQTARVELMRLAKDELSRALELAADVERIDHDNTDWLRGMVVGHGWPRRSHVGDEAAQAAWLIAQHADHDPDFQGHCLELMRSLPRSEVNAAQVAMLTDRVLLRTAGRQRYGTQWKLVDGDWSPLPLEDAESVDELRRLAGLGPLSEHRQVIAENHGKSGFLEGEAASEQG